MRLLNMATSLTTPLIPGDYLGLVNPLWSVRTLRGRVEAVLPETREAASLVIRPGRGWVRHRPGQYTGIGVDVAGVLRWRSYSLSSAPDRPDGCITITVKAVADGLVSPRLVRMAPGTILRLARPVGEFVLPEPAPARLLLITAGSGITPIMSVLRDLVARDVTPDVVLVHSAPTPEAVIFGAELRGLAARFRCLRLIERHTRTGAGRFTVAELPDVCPDWGSRYALACGPNEMLDDLVRHWADTGIGDQLHVERFRQVRVPGGRGGRVRFIRSGREAGAAAGTPLLVVGEDAGVLMPSGCRMGICHSCVAVLKSGRVRDLRTGVEHGEEGELVQTCVSAAAGAVGIYL